MFSKQAVKPSKSEIKEAKKSRDREKIKAAKAKYKKLKEDNEKIEIAQYVMKEIHKFESPVVQMQVERAEKVCEAGINGLYTLNTISLKGAKALPKNSETEKEMRLCMIEIARQEKRSKKLLSRCYENGIQEFDYSVFDSVVSEISALEKRQAELIDEIKLKKKPMQQSLEKQEKTASQRIKNNLDKRRQFLN